MLSETTTAFLLTKELRDVYWRTLMCTETKDMLTLNVTVSIEIRFKWYSKVRVFLLWYLKQISLI
jgi:hypothetical protein